MGQDALAREMIHKAAESEQNMQNSKRGVLIVLKMENGIQMGEERFTTLQNLHSKCIIILSSTATKPALSS